MSSINRYIPIEQLFNRVPRLSKSNLFLHGTQKGWGSK